MQARLVASSMQQWSCCAFARLRQLGPGPVVGLIPHLPWHQPNSQGAVPICLHNRRSWSCSGCSCSVDMGTAHCAAIACTGAATWAEQSVGMCQ